MKRMPEPAALARLVWSVLPEDGSTVAAKEAIALLRTHKKCKTVPESTLRKWLTASALVAGGDVVSCGRGSLRRRRDGESEDVAESRPAAASKPARSIQEQFGLPSASMSDDILVHDSRARDYVVSLGTARLAIGTISKGMDVFGLTKGRFSLGDLISVLVDACGVADVTIATWTAGRADIQLLWRAQQRGKISRVRWIVDRGFPSSNPEYMQFLAARYPDTIRLTRNHAKFAIVRGGGFDFAVRSSMNLNKNPRCEFFEVSDDAKLCDFLDLFVSEIFETPTEPSVWAEATDEAEKAFKALLEKSGKTFSPTLRKAIALDESRRSRPAPLQVSYQPQEPGAFPGPRADQADLLDSEEVNRRIIRWLSGVLMEAECPACGRLELSGAAVSALKSLEKAAKTLGDLRSDRQGKTIKGQLAESTREVEVLRRRLSMIPKSVLAQYGAG